MFSSKITKKSISKKAVFVFLLFAFCSMLFYTTYTHQAKGAALANVSGFGWSDNVGWISFNCMDMGMASCLATYYGVYLDETTNKFSGYAWGDNVGWISFESTDVSGCPNPSCQPKLNNDDTVSGWAKALSADDNGWDGWISLSGTDYGVTFNSLTNKFEGYAWGGDVVGWISFNCQSTPGGCVTSDYAVELAPPANNLPTVEIKAPTPLDGLSRPKDENIFFTGWGNDSDGDTLISAQWRDYGTVSNVGDCSGGFPLSMSGNIDTLTGVTTFDEDKLALGVHYICVRVKDDHNNWSLPDLDDKVKVTIEEVTYDCSDGSDSFSDFDTFSDEDDPGCHSDFDSTNNGSYVPTDDNEGDEPACSNSDDDDGDGLPDDDDPGCHTDGDPLNSVSYNPADNTENDCGDGVCSPGETYPICPQDCSFIWFEF